MNFLKTIFFFLSLSGFAIAGGQKAPEVAIQFYLQEKNQDPGDKLTFTWQTAIGPLHFKRGSEFRTDEIIAHRPFPSPHSESEYGMVFQLSPAAANRLSILTANASNHGKHLIVFMNLTPIDMVRIDKKIDDGLICVWRGLTAAEVHIADEMVPRIGEDKETWKARRKKEIKNSKAK
jgi:hypothetical protein